MEIRGWKAWEKETASNDYEFANDASRFRLVHETSFVRAHTSFWTRLPFMFTIGCDASILLDDSPTIKSEKSATPNKNSAGGPTWTVKLGRRDSTTTNFDQASNGLPFFRDNLQKLIKDFSEKGFTIREMVALSGAHSFGQAQCFTFRDRIYNNASDINVGFASTRRRNCPSSGGDGNLAPLDLVTLTSFDNYYKNILQKKGLLETDQILLNGGSTDDIMRDYSKNPTTFKNDFASAMAKMSDLSPLTGLLALTRVESRMVLQISAIFMLLFSIVGKFGAVVASIPLPIFGAIYCVLFGYMCISLNYL